MGSPDTAINCTQSQQHEAAAAALPHRTATTAAPQHLGDQQRGAPTCTPQPTTTTTMRSVCSLCSQSIFYVDNIH